MKKLLVVTLVAVVMLLLAISPVNAQIFFETDKACGDALLSGQAEEYQPKYFGLNKHNSVDGVKRVTAQLEDDACVRMLTTAKVKWVVQKKGTVLRWNKKEDGSLGEPYANDACGNDITGIFYPQSSVSPDTGIAKKKEASSPTDTETTWWQRNRWWAIPTAITVGLAITGGIIAACSSGGGNSSSSSNEGDVKVNAH